MAKKGGMPVYPGIDDYISEQKEAAKAKLTELRKLVHRAVPGARELSDQKVPTFVLVPTHSSQQQLMIAAYSKFISFYPFAGTIAAFAEDLRPYKVGKGSVQFPLDGSLPEELILRMVKYREEELRDTLK